MDTRQTLNIVDKYFNTLEIFGSANHNDFITLLYLMFIDEYYELKRDISLKYVDDNKLGLTDCFVKKLNANLEYFKNNSNILQGIELDYLPTKLHWIIEDTDDEKDSDYVINHVFNTNDTITNQTLITTKQITNHILQL